MSAKRYPKELRERPVRMVRESREQDPNDRGVIGSIPPAEREAIYYGEQHDAAEVA